MNHRAHLHSAYLPKSVFGEDYLVFDQLDVYESISDLFSYRLIVKAKDEHGNPAHGIQGLEGYVSYDAYVGSIIPPKEDDASSTSFSSSHLSSSHTPSSHQGTTSYQSIASHLDLISLIGTPLGVSLDLNDVHPLDNRTITGQITRHGLITEVCQLTTHNRHAVYELILKPWTYLLTQTNNFRIYQNKSVINIIDDVLSCYPYAYEYRLTNNYPSLDYQTQYDESDHTFITRLMSEHGLSFYFEHTKDNHTLIITDHLSHLKRHANPFYDTLTLHPPHQRMPEFAEYLEHFHPKGRLTPAGSLVSDYQFKTPDEILIAKEHYPNTNRAPTNRLQRYEWAQGRRASLDEIATLSQNLSASYQRQRLNATGQGRLKGLQIAHLFTLTGHPHQSMNTDWVIHTLQMSIKPIDTDNNTHQYYTADTHFSAEPATHPLVPTNIHPRPMARPQTATVIAPDGEEIHTDQYGRIKVKFHWDKPTHTQRHPLHHEQNDLENPEQTGTCYLRLAQNLVGNHYGTQTLPRVGMEVIVDFFGGNPDMPYIVACLTGPTHLPLYTLPDEKVLSGIRSKEYEGEKSNQLIMDDTTGKLQTQLKSDHLHTEINLGHIRRLTIPQGRGEYRGEGFEVRTDGHGVVRAGRGLLLSTQARTQAQSHLTDIQEPIGIADTAYHQHTNLANSAISHQAQEEDDQSAVAQKLSEQLQALRGAGDTKEISSPQLTLHSPEGIQALSDKSLHLASAHHTAVTASQHISLSAGKSLLATVRGAVRFFAQLAGIRLFAAKGKIELDAQTDGIDVLALNNIKIHSNNDWVEITAKQGILINAGGSYIRITPQGIEQGTDGDWKALATSHELSGANSLPIQTNSPLFNDEMFVLRDMDGNILANERYKIVSKSGEVFYGVTDKDGQTERIFTGGLTDDLEVFLDDR